MDEDYILRQIVGSFNPEDALDLPFCEQRGIIREITGYTVSDPDVARLYLEIQDIDVLVDDPAVAAVMRKELAEEGYVLTDVENLRAYVESRSAVVLAREDVNWPVLQERYPEQFEDLLLQAGTTTARQRFEELKGRELDVEQEAKISFLASLEVGDFENLRYIESFDAGIILEYDTPEARREIVALTDRQVRNAIRYEDEGGDDFTVFFPPAYYLEGAVVEFLYYMSLLDERSRMYAMYHLIGWHGIEFDINNPVVQAYIEIFPDDEAARELVSGGAVALKQMLEPNPFSEYSRSRGEHYVAEQRYKMLANYHGTMISPMEVEQARQEVNAFRRAAGQEEIPPPA